MSAFDDEFGLFGDDDAPQEEERKPTLGARRIASSETIIDDIELEDGGPPRRRESGTRSGSNGTLTGARRGGYGERNRFERSDRPPADPVAAQKRAAELLYFLAQKLVSKPEMIAVQTVAGDRGPVLELEVDHEDVGKVIGRAGRVAMALRTIVRAGAEGKVSVEIVEVESDDDVEATSGDAEQITDS